MSTMPPFPRMLTREAGEQSRAYAQPRIRTSAPEFQDEVITRLEHEIRLHPLKNLAGIISTLPYPDMMQLAEELVALTGEGHQMSDVDKVHRHLFKWAKNKLAEHPDGLA